MQLCDVMWLCNEIPRLGYMLDMLCKTHNEDKWNRKNTFSLLKNNCLGLKFRRFGTLARGEAGAGWVEEGVSKERRWPQKKTSCKPHWINPGGYICRSLWWWKLSIVYWTQLFWAKMIEISSVTCVRPWISFQPNFEPIRAANITPAPQPPSHKQSLYIGNCQLEFTL